MSVVYYTSKYDGSTLKVGVPDFDGLVSEQVTNMDLFLPEEFAELAKLRFEWKKAREEKNWIVADMLRQRVKQWDRHFYMEESGIWIPRNEMVDHWLARVYHRIIKYKVNIYPFDYKDDKIYCAGRLDFCKIS